LSITIVTSSSLLSQTLALFTFALASFKSLATLLSADTIPCVLSTELYAIYFVSKESSAGNLRRGTWGRPSTLEAELRRSTALDKVL
jgi:hypothetical protein